MTDEPDAPDRTPPHDAVAEQCVLGGMLLSRDAIADAVEIVTARDFYRPIHADIYTAILDRYSRGEPTDPINIAAHLVDTGLITKIPGGAAYLHDLVEVIPLPASTGWHARTVANRATRRRLIEAGMSITQLGYATNGDDNSRLADKAGELLYAATSDRLTSDLTPIGNLLQPMLDSIEAASTHVGLRGLATGLRDLDTYTNGLQPGHLWVVAGRPGMGKSVAASDFARAVAIHQRQPVIYFSLEMCEQELNDRIASAESGVKYRRIQTGQLTEEDWTRLTKALGNMADAPLYIDDTPGATITEIRAKARRLAQRNALGLVVVDYLQLMEGVGGKANDNREREVARISRGLKLLAKELAVPVIAVAQLNRGPEARMDKVPQLADLRESGAVEQDADVVVLLHREDYYAVKRGKEVSRPGEVDLIVAKNRHGQQGTVTACAQLHCQRFVDMAPPHRF